MAKLYVQAVPPPDLNRNTEWFMYPGVWTTYILILFFSWILVLSVFGCAPGTAWTLVNLGHFAAAELHLIELFEVANLLAVHGKRVTISKLSKLKEMRWSS